MIRRRGEARRVYSEVLLTAGLETREQESSTTKDITSLYRGCQSSNVVWTLTSAGSIPSSRNCCRESTSFPGEAVFLSWVCAGLPVAVDGSTDLRSCMGLWWEEREEVGC